MVLKKLYQFIVHYCALFSDNIFQGFPCKGVFLRPFLICPDIQTRCRSPTLSFLDFQIIQEGRKIMEVHIKIHGQNIAVEVSVEVYEYLNRADHKTENLFHEQRRHWDGRKFDELSPTSAAGATMKRRKIGSAGRKPCMKL